MTVSLSIRTASANCHGQRVWSHQDHDTALADEPGGVGLRGEAPMISWLTWLAARAPVLPVAWVLAHATVLLWKALDPRYIDGAQWIVDTILKPLHPLAVWMVSAILPQLRTLVANMPPTH